MLPACPSPRKTRVPQAINSSMTITVAGAPNGRLTRETPFPPISPLYNGSRGPHHHDGESLAPIVLARDLTVLRFHEPMTIGPNPSWLTETPCLDAQNSTAARAVKRSFIERRKPLPVIGFA